MTSWHRHAGRLALAATLACGGAAGCDDELDDTKVSDDQLATLRFDAYVYVEPNATEQDIVQRVRHETQSAMSALHKAGSIDPAEAAPVDPSGFINEAVSVVDPATFASRPGVRLRYGYEDDVVVHRFAVRPPVLHLPLLQRQDLDAAVLERCVGKAAGDGVFGATAWRAFDPTLETCREAFAAELRAIKAARAPLRDPDHEVVEAEIDRTFVPVTLRFASRADLGPRRIPAAEGTDATGVDPTTGAKKDPDAEETDPIEIREARVTQVHAAGVTAVKGAVFAPQGGGAARRGGLPMDPSLLPPNEGESDSAWWYPHLTEEVADHRYGVVITALVSLVLLLRNRK